MVPNSVNFGTFKIRIFQKLLVRLFYPTSKTLVPNFSFPTISLSQTSNFIIFFRSFSIHISKNISISTSQSDPNTKFQLSNSIPFSYTIFSTIYSFSNFVCIFKTTLKSQPFTQAVTPVLAFKIPALFVRTKFSTVILLCTHIQIHHIIPTLRPS